MYAKIVNTQLMRLNIYLGVKLSQCYHFSVFLLNNNICQTLFDKSEQMFPSYASRVVNMITNHLHVIKVPL